MGKKPLKKQRCMNPDCRHGHPPEVTLGICANCYGRFVYWIKKTKELPSQKQLTWEKLARRKICKPKTNAMTLAMSRKELEARAKAK